jgi:catechol 2,3-dioxygenase-like lactoylglutathione lyase family enzyme
MLNVIVRDMAASLDFYQRLGIPFPDAGTAPAPTCS